MLTDSMLRQITPNCPARKRAEVLAVLNDICVDYGIVNERRMAAFLATLAVESAEFRYQEEIASGAAYEGRRDLGNNQPGDGRRFKGRGRIQITGRYNYQAYTNYLKQKGHLPFVDFVANPKALAQEPYATDSAAWFFAVKIKANQLADQRQFLTIQTRVNGRNRKTGLPNHWEQRRGYYERALRILPDNFFLQTEAKPLALLPEDDILEDNAEPDFNELTGSATANVHFEDESPAQDSAADPAVSAITTPAETQTPSKTYVSDPSTQSVAEDPEGEAPPENDLPKEEFKPEPFPAYIPQIDTAKRALKFVWGLIVSAWSAFISFFSMLPFPLQVIVGGSLAVITVALVVGTVWMLTKYADKVFDFVTEMNVQRADPTKNNPEIKPLPSQGFFQSIFGGGK